MTEGSSSFARESVGSSEKSRPAVAVEGLTRRFGAFVAVDDVSFTVSRGEIFGFLGPNGAGKTTTIKILTGLLDPSEGTARVAGLDVQTERTALRSVIGYMSQKFSLYGDLTVEENIEFFSGLYGVVGERYRRRRDWVLEMAGLTAASRRVTAELPLGWKQRLALGCAVLHEPPILFLDEPTSGVDPMARRRFWDLIDGLSQAGTTVFVSTHYMEEAEYCTRMALMNRGRLIALDSPGGLRDAMRDPVLQIAVSEAPRAVDLLAGAPGIREAALFGRAVHVLASDLAVAQNSIRDRLGPLGVGPEAVAPVEPSLEDVFVSMVLRAGGAPEE